MRRLKNLTLGLAAAIAMIGCSLDVPDLNNPGLDSLEENPTPSAISAAATGLLIGNRAGYSANNGYIVLTGILGREAYNFDAADPRFITEMLEAPTLDPGSPAFGGNFWTNPYANIRNANTILAALDKVTGMSDAEKEATRGFAKTIMALDYLIVINTRDENGAVIHNGEPIDELPPIVGKAEVFAHIVDLLDQAKDHLANGGEAFPFALSTGYAGFDAPATFTTFNRALRARVDVYMGNYDLALDSLAESFLVVDDAAPQLELGVFHVYGTGSGDVLNSLNSPNIFAHPSILQKAAMKPDGEPDNRVANRLAVVEERTVQGLTSNLQFARYQAVTASSPIIRNEELILLRAEANLFEGNLEAAAADLNFVREKSGGLAPRDDLDADNFVDELLDQRALSLLFEGGHRWIDARRFDRLDELPLDQPQHNIHAAFPIPVQETDARE